MSGPPLPAGFGFYGLWIFRLSCESRGMRESSKDHERRNRVGATRCYAGYSDIRGDADRLMEHVAILVSAPAIRANA
jgi:hypothetical protein